MPEGPEVTITTHYLTEKIKNLYLIKIIVNSGRYVHNTLKGLDLIDENLPLKIKKIDSKGKLLWFKLKSKKNKYIYIACHFGLTGEWFYDKNITDKARIILELKDSNDMKHYLVFYDQRNFGTLTIYDEFGELEDKLNKIAPDSLKFDYTFEIFENITKLLMTKFPKQKNKPIVEILLEQNINKGILSGLGNYLVAEILYRAKLSPYRNLESLTMIDLKNLYHSIKYTTKISYFDNKTGYMKNFEDYIDEHKKKIQEGLYPNYHKDIITDERFEFCVYRKKRDKCNNEIISDEIVKGRKTYWVPTVQK